MKTLVLTYKGFLNETYHFINGEGELYVFKRGRNDLIREFGLKTDQSIDMVFHVKYFEDYKRDHSIFIISDLIPII